MTTTATARPSTTSGDARPSSSGPRVRPLTWVILAGVILAVAAVLGAWQGSAARLGAVPELTVASDTGHTDVPPFTAADLSGRQLSSPPVTVEARDDQVLTVRLPVELQRTRLTVFVERGAATEEHPVTAGSSTSLRIPVTSPAGRLTHVAVSGLPSVYDDDGDESLLSGEWAFSVVPSGR